MDDSGCKTFLGNSIVFNENMIASTISKVVSGSQGPLASRYDRIHMHAGLKLLLVAFCKVVQILYFCCRQCCFLYQLFVELDELYLGENAEFEWKEKSRWIKFEEDVEEGAERWGKPHVASLSFHSLLELRKCIEQGKNTAYYTEFGYNEHPAITNNFLSRERILLIEIMLTSFRELNYSL